MRKIRTLVLRWRGWKRVYGQASEALPKEMGSKRDRPNLRNTAPVLEPTDEGRDSVKDRSYSTGSVTSCTV